MVLVALTVAAAAGLGGGAPDREAEETKSLIQRLGLDEWSAGPEAATLHKRWHVDGLPLPPEPSMCSYGAVRSPDGKFVLFGFLRWCDMVGMYGWTGDEVTLVGDDGKTLWRRQVRFLKAAAVANTGTVAIPVGGLNDRQIVLHLVGKDGKTLCTHAEVPRPGAWHVINGGRISCHGFSSDGNLYYFVAAPGGWERPELCCMDLEGKVRWRTRLDAILLSFGGLIRASAGGRFVALGHTDELRGAAEGFALFDGSGHLLVIGSSGARVDIGFGDGRVTIDDWMGRRVLRLPERAFPDEPAAGPNVSPWGETLDGLQGRLIIEHESRRQGESIWARVEIRNTTDKPVPCDVGSPATGRDVRLERFLVTAPGGAPAPRIGPPPRDFRGRRGSEIPRLAPGESLVLLPTRLDACCYMRKPGAYAVRWESDRASGWPELPPTGTARVTVTPAPNGEPDGDLVGRLLKVLPDGWIVSSARLLQPDVAPYARRAGRGSCVGLLHRPDPASSENEATIGVCIMAEPAELDPAWEHVTPSRLLGKGELGHVYLRTARVEGRWSQAERDIALALGVEPPPPKPQGPDWGRLVCRILARCQKRAAGSPGFGRFLRDASLNPWKGGELAAIRFVVRPRGPAESLPLRWAYGASFWYDMALSVRPLGQPAPDGRLIRKSEVLERLGLEVYFRAASDDAGFRDAMNAILEREVERFLDEANRQRR